METMLEQLRAKLQDSQLNVQSCNAELQQLQTEYDTLLERHNKMLQQTIAKEAELRDRYTGASIVKSSHYYLLMYILKSYFLYYESSIANE